MAAAQLCPPRGRPDDARIEIVAAVTAAARERATLVVLPEMATTGYVWASRDEIAPHVEPADGPTLAALSAACRRGHIWAHVGFAELADDGTLYNSSMLIDDRGELAHVYRKVLLFDLDYTWASAGTERAVVETPIGRAAPAICMDLNDEGFRRFVAVEAPDVVLFNANWLDQGVDVVPYWVDRLRPWTGWLVAANRWGSERGVRFRGHSAIVAPNGSVVAQAAGAGDALLVADVGDPGQHGARDVRLDFQAIGPRAERPAPENDMRREIMKVIEELINPAVAGHGGAVHFEDYVNGKVYIRFSGGCQGCSSSNATLKNGIDRLIREEFPDVVEVVDVTDHDAGNNPYYS